MKGHSLVRVAAVGNLIRFVCAFKNRKNLKPHKTIGKLNKFSDVFLKCVKLYAQKSHHLKKNRFFFQRIGSNKLLF